MPGRIDGWADLVALGLRLPHVEEGTSYGKPALKLNGRMIAATTAPDDGSFVLRVATEEKDALIATDPDTFWETDHYRGLPAVLVRYGTDAGERIACLLARAWWDWRAKA
ncbi:hypothetical protein AB5I41_05140 [Sphingomonas sp. MMS24-JH45]